MKPDTPLSVNRKSVATLSVLVAALVVLHFGPRVFQGVVEKDLASCPVPLPVRLTEVSFRTAVTSVRAQGTVVFFFDQGCPDCAIVKDILLPVFLDLQGLDGEHVTALDVARPETVDELYRLEKQLKFKATVLAPVVVVGDRAYCGVKELRSAVEALKSGL